jgi:NTE family protein
MQQTLQPVELGSGREAAHTERVQAASRTALVLGAGGVVGHAFHVGVLSTLAEVLGWDARRADLVVGTSAGAVVGASLRAGLGPVDLRRRLAGEPLSPEGADLVGRAQSALAALGAAGAADARGDGEASAAEEVASVVIARRLRIASPERVRRALRQPWKVTPGSLVSAVLPAGRHRSDHLRAPHDAMIGAEWPQGLWIVAVDLDVGTRVVFGRSATPAATVGQAVEASCAIPGYFAPVTVDGSRYVDGAVHSTTNADLAGGHEPQADLVVISAPMSAVSGAVPRSRTLSIRQLARRQVAGEVAALRAKGIATVVFQPTADDLAVMAGNSMDSAKAAAVSAQIAASTRAHLEEPDIAARLSVLRR